METVGYVGGWLGLGGGRGRGEDVTFPTEMMSGV